MFLCACVLCPLRASCSVQGTSTVTANRRRVMSACASPVHTTAPRIPVAEKATRRARDQLLDLRFSAHGRDAIAYACHSTVRRARRARLTGRRPCFEVVHLVRPVHRRPLASVLSRAYTPPGGGPRPRAHRPRSRPPNTHARGGWLVRTITSTEVRERSHSALCDDGPFLLHFRRKQ